MTPLSYPNEKKVVPEGTMKRYFNHALRVVLGAYATIVAYGFYIETIWSKQALLMLVGIAVILFVRAVRAKQAKLAFEANIDEVVRSRVCPAWYLETLDQCAFTGGFHAEWQHQLSQIGDRPSGIRVMNVYQLAKKYAAAT